MREALKRRTKEFSIAILRSIDNLPRTPGAQVSGRQLAESATSVGANYRGVCTARSRAEFIAKLGIVVEESDESVYWLELLVGARYCNTSEIERLTREAIELRSIFSRSLGTARENYFREKSNSRRASK